MINLKQNKKMSPIFPITATHTEALLAYVAQVATDLWLLIALAIGIPFAFYFIARVIGMLPKGRARK